MNVPEPVSTTIAPGAERQRRAPAAAAAPEPAPSGDMSTALGEQIPDILPPLPPLPDPPGTAYVAAVLSGALSPRPVTPQEIYRRTGEWTPPDSPFRLADKII